MRIRLLFLALVLSLAAAGTASAQIVIGARIGGGPRYYAPRPRYYAPPVVVAPAPVYYAPPVVAPPVYYAPRPVYYAPRPVYYAPRPRPYYGRGYYGRW
jgi:hypothetical protein